MGIDKQAKPVLKDELKVSPIEKTLCYAADPLIRIRKRIDYAVFLGEGKMKRTAYDRKKFIRLYLRNAGMLKPTLTQMGWSFANWEWSKQFDPEFRKDLEKVDDQLMEEAEDRLKYFIAQNEGWALKFFLSHRHPKYRSEKVQNMMVIANGRTLEDILDEGRTIIEQKDGQQTDNRGTVQNTGQEAGAGEVSAESGPKLLLEKENPEERHS
jgi:hypothetical protein